MLSEEVEPALEDQVQTKLNIEGYSELMVAVPLMRKDLQEAILNDMLPFSWYDVMKERVSELKRGHLARGEDDSTPGAIHWFEGELTSCL